MECRIAVGVVAFGESEIRQCEVDRAHRLDLDAETAEQRQSLAEGHLCTLTQSKVVVNLLAIFEGGPLLIDIHDDMSGIEEAGLG